MKKTFIALFIASISIFSVGCNNATTTTPNDNNNTPNNTSQNKITIDEAKNIALKHANLTEDKVNFVKAKEDTNSTPKKYDIEFTSNNTEYDYEINADTGEIIEFDKDIDNYNTSNNTTTNATTAKITEQQAKDIALKHANLTSDKVTFTKTDYETDNGRTKYEIDFYYNNQEYDYEIDAQTGEILSHSIEKQ